jgi:hypothetical protein
MSQYYCGPTHLTPRKGKGWRQCQRSGQLTWAEDVIEDVRGGAVRKASADLTPGFGTHHPSDVIQLGALGDPTDIPDARPDSNPGEGLSKQDLGLSDDEIRASVIAGVPPSWR